MFLSRNIMAPSQKISRLISTQCLEYAECGDPLKVLNLKQTEIGSIGASQILLKILASPINPADVNMIQGTYALKPKLPSVAGSEAVAQVQEVGPHVTDLAPGDWVIPCRQGLGTWRQFCALERDDVMKIRNDIPLLSASTLAVNPCTAYRMLRDFVTPEPGRILVQNGANGAVGQGVIQLSREMGLVTVNIVRNRPDLTETKTFLKSLGANYIFTEEEFSNNKIMKAVWLQHGRPKLALNCVGGYAAAHLASCLDEGGKLVTYGGMSKQPMQIPVGPFIFKSIELHGFWISKWNSNKANEKKRMEMLNELMLLMKNGRYATPACETVTLEKYAEALQKSMGGFSKKQIFVF